MNASNRYVKIVEWSEEDHCFVGSCPGLFFGGCHGSDEQAVFAELCEIVNETIERFQREGRPLPPPRMESVVVGACWRVRRDSIEGVRNSSAEFGSWWSRRERDFDSMYGMGMPVVS